MNKNKGNESILDLWKTKDAAIAVAKSTAPIIAILYLEYFPYQDGNLTLDIFPSCQRLCLSFHPVHRTTILNAPRQ